MKIGLFVRGGVFNRSTGVVEICEFVFFLFWRWLGSLEKGRSVKTRNLFGIIDLDVPVLKWLRGGDCVP